MSLQQHASKFAVVLTLIAAFIPFSARAGEIGNPVNKGGFTFINFDPSLGTLGTGSNANGISSKGHVVVTVLNSDGSFTNFTGTPNQTVQLNLGPNALAFAMNRNNVIVGTNNGVAFVLAAKGSPQLLSSPAGASSAFGINDKGQIVGQYTNANGQTPGFFLNNMMSTAITINAPSGPTL